MAQKDRLTIFSYELKEELTEDVFQIMNIFIAKINGIIKYKIIKN